MVSAILEAIPLYGLVRSYFNPCPRGSTIATLQKLDALPLGQKPATIHESVCYLVSEFCNDPDEWHSLVYGFESGFAGDESKFDRYQIPVYFPADVKRAIRKEYHYYWFGLLLGRAAKYVRESRIVKGAIAALAAYVIGKLTGLVPF